MSLTRSGTTRREWLKQGSALGLTALGGCACPLPSLPLGEIPPLRPGALVPVPPRPGSLELPIVIDAHCHIFNVDDVPASAMLKGPVAHTLEQFPRALVRALADAVALVARLVTPSARTELGMLEQVSAEHGELVAKLSGEDWRHAARSALLGRRKMQMQSFSSAMEIAAWNPRFAEPFSRQLELYGEKNPRVKDVVPVDRPLSADVIYKSLEDPYQFLPDRAPVPGGKFADESDPFNLVRFAFALTSPRFLNLVALQETYSGGTNVPAIDVFCPSNLDLDYWLGCRDTATSQDDHVRLLEQIAIMSGGAILPFIGFNPRSDLEGHERSFERVVDAVSNCGFIGVKLYPPMGYLAYGNAGQDHPGACPAMPDADEIDARLGRLYAWCADHNVPIMSHTSHSFGKTDAHDDCASPVGWRRALDAFGGLRVQAGHFGGDSQYALGKAWAADYVEMMGTANGANLNVDLSNLGKLFEPGSAVRKAIEPLFAREVSKASGEIAANRMVYGSDWYMTLLSNASGAYAANMSGYLDHLEHELRIPVLRKWVFGQNAVKLYGLDKSTCNGRKTNRARLEFYYERKNIGCPVWLRKLQDA